MTDWEFYYYLLENEEMTEEEAYKLCTKDTSDAYDGDYREDAYVGYDCDGYAIGQTNPNGSSASRQRAHLLRKERQIW